MVQLAPSMTVSPGPPLRGAELCAFAANLFFVGLEDCPDGDAIERIGRLRSELDTKAILLGKRLTDDNKGWVARSAFNNSTDTAADANRQNRRVRAVVADERLADALAAHKLTAGHVDVIAQTTRRGGVTSTDVPDNVIGRLQSMSADQARSDLKRWLADRTTREDAEQRYERQQALRKVERYSDDDTGAAGLRVEGDDASIDQMYKKLCARADELYRQDGGREAGAPARSSTQRRFDALFKALCGQSSSGGSGSKAQVVISADLGVLGRGGCAEQIGTGPISDQQFRSILASNPVVRLLVTGAGGEPLWLGRAKRAASAAQFVALAIRDRGCVLCGAGLHQCQAHHRIPWNAPLRGRTDLDNLALLCGSCHQLLHLQDRTLVRNEQGVWHTRPALPEERPPPRPQRE